MRDAGSTAIALLEAVNASATRVVPDLPPVAFTIKASGRGKTQTTLGHFAPDRYKADGAPLHEICLTGDTIRRGAESVLVTVLHEAAHALAAARGVKDTSRQNRYHNTRFVKLAEELLLTYDIPENYRLVPTPGQDPRSNDMDMEVKLVADATIGYSNVGLTPFARLAFAGDLDLLAKDFPFDLGHGRATESKPRRVLHGYYVPMARWSFEPTDLVQIAPSRYRALKSHLSPGDYCESTADEDLVLHVLLDKGVSIPNKAPSRDYRYELDDIEAEHPELLTLAEEIQSNYV